MDRTSLLELDEALCTGIEVAQAAAKERPEQARNFRRIIGMLWSARDELDLIVSRPQEAEPPAPQTLA